MVETKSLADTKAAWEAAIGRVPEAYKRGVEGTSNVIEKSKAAEDLWAARVQEAASRRAREAGLADVSDADWKKAAIEKGAARIGAGMNASKEKFGRGMGEVLSTLQGVSLPARTADPLANVDNRVKPIVSALVERFRK